MSNKHANSWLSLVVISYSYYAIYNLQLMKSLYYSSLQYGFHINNVQIGQIFGICGLLAMAAYLSGSFFLQRMTPKLLMILSSVIMSVLCLLLSFLPPYPVLLLIFGIAGFLVNATFYPSYLSMMQNIGGLYNQGKTYASFYIFSSIFGCLFSMTGFQITALIQNAQMQLRYLLIFFAIINSIGALLIGLFLPSLPKINSGGTLFDRQTLSTLTHNKRFWLAILIVFANYVNFSNLNYTLPYLTNQFQIPPKVVNLVSLLRVYLIILIAAPLAGFITDRMQSAVRLIKYSFLFYTVLLLAMILFCQSSNTGTILCIIGICFFVSIGKSMSLVVVSEVGIPPYMSTLALSILSFLSYSPDAFYYVGSGWMLDHFTSTGYIYIFFISGIIAFIGYLACVRFPHMPK